MIRPSIVIAISLVSLPAAAQWRLFTDLSPKTVGERSSLSAECDADPDKNSVLNCRFVQRRIVPGLSPAEVAKRRSEAKALFDQPEAGQFLSGFCDSLLKPLTVEQRENLKNPITAASLDELSKACKSKDRIAAVKEVFIKGSNDKTTECLIPPDHEWTARFFRQEQDTFKTEPEQGPTCGAISVETISKNPSTMVWTYKVQRVYLDRTDKKCSGLPDKSEMTYSSEISEAIPIKCTSVKFGVRN